MRDMIYGVVLTVVCTGLVFAMDQRIDQRIEVAIDASNERQIENKLDFYLMKDEMSELTPDDRINQKILERQLKKLRGK